MSTYDNLNIALTSLTFASNGNTSVASGTFDLSSLAFLPNIPLIDQIEVERVFDTGYDTKFGAYAFTIADRRQLFIFPKDWYTINEQTKVLTFKDLSTIPTYGDNSLYYPYSRTYVLQNAEQVTIPVVQGTSSFIAGITREYDKVYIRRKTPSINSIVTFAPGTRLTTTQLNLQFDQLKYNIQELVAKFRNEAILKYDENAVDGPFLGQGDLKMNNNYIKDVNSPAFTQAGTNIVDPTMGLNFNANTFLVNLGAVVDGIVNGTLHRTGVTTSSSAFTGDFTADSLKIINVADGTNAKDAVNLSQLSNADNLTAGTVGVNRLPLNISLANLSSAVGQVYTLPLENLYSSLTTTAGPFGASTASSTNNMLYGGVNSKGMLTSLYSRNMTVDDLPTVSTIVAQAYGGVGKRLEITADAKGRITAISATALSTSDLPNTTVVANSYGADTGTNTNVLTRFTVDGKGNLTSAGHRSIEVNDLPTTNVTEANTYGQSAANNSNNMVRLQYDAKGRVLLASHRSMGTADLPANIPLSKLSGTNDNYTLPPSAIGNGSILFSKLDTVTANQGTLPLTFIPQNIPLNYIDSTVFNTFSLPNGCLANTGTAGTFGEAAPALTIVTDTKGRVTSITPRNLTATDIPPLDAGKITTGTFDAGRIPTSVVTSNAVFWDSPNFTALRSGNRTRIRGVATPVDSSDAVPLDYFTGNALVSSGGLITAAQSSIINMPMRAVGSIGAQDAVNFGFIESVVLSTLNATNQLVGTIVPQVYRVLVSAAIGTPATVSYNSITYNKYSYTFTDGTNPLYATTSTMVLVDVEGSAVKFVPQTLEPTNSTAFNGYFWLEIVNATTKKIHFYTTGTALTTSLNITYRNFGLSRLVSGAVATTGSQGIVSVDGTNGGITVIGGALSLTTATSTQLGGIKIGTGLAINSGTATVDLSDSTTLDDSTKVATSKAVRTLSTTSMLLSGTQQMTGKLSLAAPNSTRANILLPSASLDPGTLVDGDLWHNNGTLKFRSSATTKTIAFLGDNVATASALQNSRTFSITGAVTATAVSFNGTDNVSLSTSPANNSITLGTHTTGNYAGEVTAGTGITVSGTAGEGTSFGITNNDRGSSQLIYGTVALTGTTTGDASIAAASNTQTLTLNAGTGVSLAGNNATKTITITNTAALPNTFAAIATSGSTTVAAEIPGDTVTFVAGTGMGITTDAGTPDSVTFNNTGITSISSSHTNRVTASTTNGVVTLSGPQDIHSTATPTFGGATLGSIIITNALANTITTTGNLDLILDPAGTGKISLLANVDCSTNTLTAGASTLGTLSCDAITFKTNNTKLKLGTTASTIEAINTSGTGYGAGDILLRVPTTTGKAFLIADTTAVPTAGTELITKTVLDTAVASAISGGSLMPRAGSVHTAAQTLGCSAGSFKVQTGTSSIDRLTITDQGAATFAKGLTVTEGTTLSSTLVVTDAVTLNNTLVVSGNITVNTQPSTGNHVTTKTYVDTTIPVLAAIYQYNIEKLVNERTSIGSNLIVNGVIEATLAVQTHALSGIGNIDIDLTDIPVGASQSFTYKRGTGSSTTGMANTTVTVLVTAGESFVVTEKAVGGTAFTTTLTTTMLEGSYTTKQTSFPTVFTANQVLLTSIYASSKPGLGYIGYTIKRLS